MLGALGRFTYRKRWLVLVLSGVTLLASVAGLVRGGRLSSGDVVGLEAGDVRRLVEDQLHFPGDSSFTIVFRSDTLHTTDPAFMEALTAALVPLRDDARIAYVLATRPGAGADRQASRVARRARRAGDRQRESALSRCGPRVSRAAGARARWRADRDVHRLSRVSAPSACPASSSSRPWG